MLMNGMLMLLLSYIGGLFAKHNLKIGHVILLRCLIYLTCKFWSLAGLLSDLCLCGSLMSKFIIFNTMVCL